MVLLEEVQFAGGGSPAPKAPRKQAPYYLIIRCISWPRGVSQRRTPIFDLSQHPQQPRPEGSERCDKARSVANESK